MLTLNKYVAQKNEWNQIFKGRQYDLTIAADRQAIADCIDNELSPENLTCDGELSRSQVQQRYRLLTGAARELLALDPSVKFYEYS